MISDYQRGRDDARAGVVNSILWFASDEYRRGVQTEDAARESQKGNAK